MQNTPSKTPTLPKLLTILGPTATGKSDLAVDIALWLKKTQGKTAEIISADSRQIYTGLDIGSGKITKKEMRGVTHHGLDIVSPKRKRLFSVSEFQKYAYQKIDEILAKGHVPILCGGTGFYISSIVDGTVFPEVAPNPELRKKLDTYSLEKLQKTLIKLDPERYAEIDTKNSVRLIRAIEIVKELGKVPKVAQMSKYDTLCIGIDTDDEVLKEKISKRIEVRMKKGMVNEAKELHKQGVTWKRMKSFGLEYGLLSELIRGKISREQFIERLNFDIWHYVKRQRAWFKRNKDIVWLDVNENSLADKAKIFVERFLKA
jgi:tRNA dimethylallyltransferase